MVKFMFPGRDSSLRNLATTYKNISINACVVLLIVRLLSFTLEKSNSITNERKDFDEHEGLSF